MSVQYTSHVFVPAESGLDWDLAPELIARALPSARVTREPSMALTPEDVAPIRAVWPDEYELWFFLNLDARQFAADLLRSVQLPTPTARALTAAQSTGSLRVEISGDNDFPDGGEHFNDWMIATDVFAALPGAFDIDQALVEEAPPRNSSPEPQAASPRETPTVDPHAQRSEPDTSASPASVHPRPWWRRLLG
ncbi:MAG: hypothetical protein ACOYBY_14005 [Dermatophilaceae bacterium]